MASLGKLGIKTFSSIATVTSERREDPDHCRDCAIITPYHAVYFLGALGENGI